MLVWCNGYIFMTKLFVHWGWGFNSGYSVLLFPHGFSTPCATCTNPNKNFNENNRDMAPHNPDLDHSNSTMTPQQGDDNDNTPTTTLTMIEVATTTTIEVTTTTKQGEVTSRTCHTMPLMAVWRQCFMGLVCTVSHTMYHDVSGYDGMGMVAVIWMPLSRRYDNGVQP